MKVTNQCFSDIAGLAADLDLTHLDPTRTLIQVFSGLVTEADVQQIQAILNKKNSSILHIGVTTAGEINNDKILQNSILVSIMEFGNVTFSSGHFDGENDYETGVNIATTLFTDKTKATLLFMDGLLTNGNDVLDGISSVDGTVPLAGGMAGDQGHFIETFIFNNSGVYGKGVVAVAFESTTLKVATNYQLGWQSIGHPMTVTKVKKNRLYELDNTPVKEIYKKYLGDEVGSRLPLSATEFPLIKQEENDVEVCRMFIQVFEDGSVLTLGNLEVGDKVRFAFGNISMILKAAQNKNPFNEFHPEAIFAYSCAARVAFLQSETAHDLEPLSRHTPVAGFFTYGEVFHRNNKNSLLNISLTLLGMSESAAGERQIPEERPTEEDKSVNMFADKHFLVLDALTNLSNVVIEELNDANRELKHTQQKLKKQASRDYLTNLYNRRYFYEIATSIITAAKRKEHEFGVMMIDIDKFKNINDTYGHAAGDEALKGLATLLEICIRESDILARLGGEEFALLLPFTDRVGTYTMAEKIRDLVEHNDIILDGNTTIRYTISIGVDCLNSKDNKTIEDTLNIALDRADKALYTAKEMGRNRVVMSEELLLDSEG